jgi:hypothetical protein
MGGGLGDQLDLEGQARRPIEKASIHFSAFPAALSGGGAIVAFQKTSGLAT